ncbi:MAG: hypothetical protein JWR80_4977 [Bradyrhizobium sp.]|nr:hypothetical protein [Bradyrhizobium sp.]
MDAPFSETAEAIADIARWERTRIELMQFLAVRGQVQPPPDLAFAGWRNRLILLEGAATIFRLLAPFEQQIRALSPDLAGTRMPPSFWPPDTPV